MRLAVATMSSIGVPSTLPPKSSIAIWTASTAAPKRKSSLVGSATTSRSNRARAPVRRFCPAYGLFGLNTCPMKER